MNSRERVKRAVRFQNPDRVPISHAILPAAQLKYGPALSEILTEYREDFGWDYMDDLPVKEFPALYKQGLNRDDFGTLWRVEWMGVCGIPVDWPVKELDRYPEYRWPDDFTAGPPKGRQYSGHMCGFDDRWYARGAWITFFEQLQQLRGMENLMVDLAAESPMLGRLLDDLLAFNLRWIEKWNRFEYDGLHFGDDWGGQHGLPFGSPAEVKEEVRRTFEACGTPSGGLIACGKIGPDVPLENIRAMYEAFREYGRY